MPLSDGTVTPATQPPPGLVAQPFEAPFLGGPAFRLADAAQAAAAVAWTRAAGGRLITCRLPAAELDRHRGPLQGAGFREIERLVTLSRPAGGEMPRHVRLVRPAEIDALAALGGRSFRNDRFHTDPRIDDAAADALKAAWVRNGLSGRARWPLIAVDAEDRPVGFNLVLAAPDAAVIDLIAVAETARGAGHGRRLVEAAAAVAADAGLARVRVGTQAGNTASLALYAATGFTRDSEAATFHWCPETDA